MVDPGRLKEASAFEGIQFLCFLYFCDSKLSGVRVVMYDLKGFSNKGAIRESNGHPGKISANIKADGQVRCVVKHLKKFIVMHNVILSGRHPFPKGGYTT